VASTPVNGGSLGETLTNLADAVARVIDAFD